MEGVEVIARSSVSQQVMDRLLDAIDSGALKPGERLPGERELAQGFGISRIPLREAIAALAAMGILERRQGQGTFVAQGEPAALGRLLRTYTRLDRGVERDLFEARALVEGDAARLAARNAGPEDLAAIERAAALLEEAVPDYIAGRRSLSEMLELDDLFHLQCAAASHNHFYIQFVGIVHAAGTNMELFEPVYGRCPEKYNDSVAFHRQVLAAIAAGDEALAQDVMREHIEAISAELGGAAQRE